MNRHSIHEPNFDPPYPEPDFSLVSPSGEVKTVRTEEFSEFPRISIAGCYIVSTGHGTSGPFVFGGVKLIDLIERLLPNLSIWTEVDVVAADGYGTRVDADELKFINDSKPIMLADTIDGQAMTRSQGLVRMIVPTEDDDALRQVKWVAELLVH